MSRRDQTSSASATDRADQPRGRRPLSPIEAALIAEACSRSDLIWVRRARSTERFRAAWHVWHDDAVALVYGTGEQMLPLLNGEVEVVARSKDSGARVVTFVAEARSPKAGSAEWEAAAKALAAERLNAADPAGQHDRWASGALVTMLVPRYVTAGGVGDDDTPSGAAPPPRGPGVTIGLRPFHLGGRQRRALRMARRRARG